MIPARAREALRAALGDALREDVSARRLTSLRVGGTVDALATPTTRAQLRALLEICAQHGVPHRVLGRGFNTIVRDAGLSGVVIQLRAFRALAECVNVESFEAQANADAAQDEGAASHGDSAAHTGSAHSTQFESAALRASNTASADARASASETAAHVTKSIGAASRENFASREARGAQTLGLVARADAEHTAHSTQSDSAATRAGSADESASTSASETANAFRAASATASAAETADTCLLRVEAGVSHATLTRYCQRRGLSGLEFGAGIPGSVGGWIAMNAGVPEREIESAVRALEVLTPGARRSVVLRRDALDFRYRELHGLAPGTIVLAALLAVTRAAPEAVAARIERELAERAARQPLDQPSCGSVFRNPRGRHAGRLLDAAGLRGKRCGGARISERHANFIVNEGDASAADVLALIGTARATVLQRTGIELETEVKIWGRETD